MDTAEQVRREQLAGYYRLREQQAKLVREYLIPMARLTDEKMRELYPHLYQQNRNGDT